MRATLALNGLILELTCLTEIPLLFASFAVTSNFEALSFRGNEVDDVFRFWLIMTDPSIGHALKRQMLFKKQPIIQKWPFADVLQSRCS